MGWLVVGVILIVLSVAVFFFKPLKVKVRRLAAGAGAVVGIVFVGLGFVYQQGVGEASVLVNSTGTIAGQSDTSGLQFKAPWQNRVVFDLFSQDVNFYGDANGTPDYSGGNVTGQQVTTSVKGGAQANVDVKVVYTLTGDNVTDLYKEYRSQERFTSQIIVPKILSTIRDVPSTATPVEFRGEKRGEIQQTILDRLVLELAPYGVTVTEVSLQDIRFSDNVEQSILAVESAQQNEAKAQADLAATEVSAQAQVVEAQAEADANALRAASLTPELIEANRVEALKIAAENGSLIIVPDGSSPLIQTPAPAAAE